MTILAGVHHLKFPVSDLDGSLGWLVVVHDPDGASIRLYSEETHDWDADRADLESPWIAPLARDRPASHRTTT
ncbi:hypothetical protein ACFXPA_03420 [Amycolatopsis sp. NPDC059090]|uniref:hypothetical protein n=1 Tax=unclassified Amycolatopsis TaxID=2618356 RepID=UPI00366CAE68